MNSPFFDHTSNNGVINDQAKYNPNMHNVLQDRKNWEEYIRGMSGNEYMIIDGPKDEQQAEKPVWVIRKQNRQKAKAPDQQDQVSVLETYYVVGANVYRAPSVQKVLSGRLMSLTKCMEEFLDTASSLPLFTPATGHRYLSASGEKARKPTDGSRAQSRAGSAPLSPGLQASRASSVEPGADTPNVANEGGAAYEDSRLLGESLGLTLRYRDEYMDENPIQGEPGAFVFKESAEHLKSRQQAEKAKAEAVASKTSNGSSSGRPSPVALTEIKTQDLAQGRKETKPDAKSPLSAGAPKLKRKRTGKVNVNSPGGQSPS